MANPDRWPLGQEQERVLMMLRGGEARRLKELTHGLGYVAGRVPTRRELQRAVSVLNGLIARDRVERIGRGMYQRKDVW